MLEQKKTSNLKTLLTALLVMALWGSLFPMVKVGYSTFHIDSSDIPSIILFAGIRFTLCGIILLAFRSVRAKRVEMPAKSHISYIFWGAFFSIILHYGFTYIALAVGEGSKSAIIKQVGFLFLSCFAFLFDKKDKFSIYKVIAGGLGFCGIVATAMDGTGLHFAIGDLLLLLASVCSVVSTLVTKKATQKVSPVAFTGYTQLMGGVFLLILGLSLGGSIAYIDLSAILALTYTCAASIVAYTLWNSLLKTGNISKLSIIKFTEPLFGVLFSGIILHEDIFKLSYLAAFLLLIAALLIENRPWRRKHDGENI